MAKHVNRAFCDLTLVRQQIHQPVQKAEAHFERHFILNQCSGRAVRGEPPVLLEATKGKIGAGDGDVAGRIECCARGKGYP